MSESQNGIDVIEESGYMSKDGVESKEEIMLRHIRKISDLSVQEFTPSYWERKPISTQGGIMMSEIYHEDKREAYSNAIDFLSDMVMPYADEKLKTFCNGLVKEEDSSFADAKKNGINQSEWVLTKLKLRRKLFQEINHFFERDDFFSSSSYGESQ